jgi:PST family polysaccharide transporter
MNRHAKVVRNILALLINQLGTWTITLVLTFVVPPYLGVKLYGAYAFVLSYVGFFALLMTLGTGTYLTWRIAREPTEAARLTINTLVLQVPLGLLWIAVCLAVLPLMDPDPLLMQLAVIMIISTVLGALYGTCGSALGGLQNMRVPAMISLASNALATAMIVTCVVLHQNVILIAASGLSAQVVGMGVMLLYTQRTIHMHLHIEPRLWPVIVKGGVPFFTWSALLVFYGQIDVPMLKIMAGNSAVAWYSVALRIISIPVFIPTTITAAILPALSKEKSAQSQSFRDLASRSIHVIAAVNIPACAGTILLAPSLLRLLHYPTSFFQAIPLIQILAVNLPLVAIDMVLGTVLIGLGKQKAWTTVGVVAAVVNPIANLWAIPATQHAYGNGAIGASLTTVFTEVVMLVGGLYLCPRAVFTGWDMFYFVRCTVATAAMLPAVWALSHVPGIGIIPAVVYGMVIYAFAAYTLQVVRNDDLKALLGVVLGRTGIASPADLWLQLRTSLAGRRHGRRRPGQVAPHVGVVVSPALTYSSPRLAAVAGTFQMEQRQPVPVRFGPRTGGFRQMDDAPNAHFTDAPNGHLTGESYGPYEDTIPISVPAGGPHLSRHELDGYQVALLANRPARRLPPAPSARRLRRQSAALRP